ncbi:uncharacterized protein LOC120129436 [Hibiscus syriacus]|uniref:uncharacterized protein LOC120129436 n=1 Tax=Hibiscus syriacus TaxID=106335 RepID=UPI001921678F|nr:uncharacterized protein LOC120129436 [Hibiscus syriacus]
MCGPKLHGGLSFFDVNLRNRALLNKWIWRFSLDEESLWKNVVAAKYNYVQDSIIPNDANVRKFSWIWCSIINPAESCGIVFLSEVKCVMGNGSKIDFWSDNWTELVSLKASFPRLFRIANKKAGKISEFGHWVNGVWEWEIELRRHLFEWEKALWSDFMLVLNRAVSAAPCDDKLRWIGSADGSYNAKSFCIQSTWVVQQRLPVIIELHKRGIHCSVQSLYVFCNCEQKTVDHVLCHCDVVWKVWQRWCSVWKVNIVFPMKVKGLLEAWFHQKIRRKDRHLWDLGFFGLIWNIWLYRNKVKFKGIVVSVDQIFNIGLIQIGVWTNAFWPSLIPIVQDFVRSSQSITLGVCDY